VQTVDTMRVEFSQVQTLDSQGKLVILSKKQIFSLPSGADQGKDERATPPTYTTEQDIPVIQVGAGKYQMLAGGDLLTEVSKE
jgi:hypothetical protein